MQSRGRMRAAFGGRSRPRVRGGAYVGALASADRLRAVCAAPADVAVAVPAEAVAAVAAVVEGAAAEEVPRVVTHGRL